MINIKCKGNLKVKLFNLDSTCKVCFLNGEKLKIKSKTRLSTSKFAELI